MLINQHVVIRTTIDGKRIDECSNVARISDWTDDTATIVFPGGQDFKNVPLCDFVYSPNGGQVWFSGCCRYLIIAEPTSGRRKRYTLCTRTAVQQEWEVISKHYSLKAAADSWCRYKATVVCRNSKQKTD